MGSWCSKEEGGKKGLSFIQFLILSSIASGVPFGAELLVLYVGVGWTLLGMVLISIFFAWPSSLISTELISLMPSNHGQIAWTYRAWSSVKVNIFGEPISDLLGFLNAANLLTFYVFAFPIIPIIFTAYLETLVGELSWGYKYLIKVAVLVLGFICGMLKIDIVGLTMNTLILVSLSPLLVGFLWRLPEIEISQWTEECSDYYVGLFLTAMTYFASGYEGMGALGGELNMSAKQLMIAFSVAVALSCLMICIPIIAAATIPYSSCYDWYDGYFAVAYGDIWTPFYYMVLLSALICEAAYVILYYVLASRLTWAMAQDALLLLPDGTLVLEAEMTLMRQSDDGDYIAAVGMDDNAINNEVTRIPLAILPKFMGQTWERTGAPLGGNVFFLVTGAIGCLFMTYDYIIIFSFYAYISTYFFVIAAFLVMRIYEPDAIRWFKFPGGTIGAWTVSILCTVLMLIFAIWAAVVYMADAAVVWAACNVLFLIYYFCSRKCCRSRRLDIDQEQYEPLIADDDNELDMATEEERRETAVESVNI